MRTTLIALLVAIQLFSFTAFAETPDTLITLGEVSVTARRHNDFGPGHSISTIDSLALRMHPHQDLGTLLSRHSGVFIKNYGPGSLSSTSLRGGTAGQTALLWNGFSLQSPMNGQADLSLLPAFFADEVQVQLGGGSALWGSGAMGGAIFMNNHRPAKQGFSAQLGISTISIGDFSQNLKLSFSQQNFSTTLRMFNKNASNQYSFVNPLNVEGLIEKQQLAAFNQRGILHETWFRLGNNHQFDLRWWWQDNDRDIPPSVDFAFYESLQKDKALRLSGQYQFTLPALMIAVRGARFNDEIFYSDNFGYEGNSFFTNLVGETEARWTPTKNLVITTGLNAQQVKANAQEYVIEKERASTALFASFKWQALENKLNLALSGRQEFVEGYEIPFSPSTSISWNFIDNWAIKANTGYSYLLPSLNDLYWNPGGNPELKPEQGWSTDLRLERTIRESENNYNFKPFSVVSLGVYNRKIKNWIVWLPTADNPWIWSPENRLEVRSYGFESQVGGYWRQANNLIKWTLRYILTEAKLTKSVYEGDPSYHKQLTYVPRHKAGANLLYQYKSIGFSYNHDFTGIRYTSSDNEEWLPAFHLGDVAIHYFYRLSAYQLGLNLGVENIWNTRYQILANRPMPLRYVRAGLTLSFN
jgi:iron complex outermembrane receptor protein